MGATQFATYGTGENVDKAFTAAREEARHEYGHGGYTGTIAEKDDWVIINDQPQADRAARRQAAQLLKDQDPRVDDKRGPAGAIAIEQLPDDYGGGPGWLFFGMAAE